MPYTKTDEMGFVSYILKNPKMLKSYGKDLGDKHISNLHIKPLYRCAVELLKKSNYVTPTIHEWSRAINNLVVEQREAGEAAIVAQQIAVDAKSIWEMPVTEITGGELHGFYVDQEKEHLIEEMQSLSRDELTKKAHEIKRRLEQITSEHLSSDSLYISMFSETGIDVTCTEVINMQTGVTTVSSGWKLFDRLMQGGFRAGEVTVFMAPKGVGKTLVLFNIAANVYLNGGRVLTIVLDNTVAEYTERVHACVCDIAIPEKQDKTLESYKELLLDKTPNSEFNDRWIVTVWPPGRKKVSDLKLLVERIKEDLRDKDLARGVPEKLAGEIDMLIVDYADLLKPEGFHQDELKGEAAVFNELVTISKELNMAVVTATQTNRTGVNAENLRLDNIGGAYAKIYAVGNVIALTQTPGEKISNQIRMEFLRCRRVFAGEYYLKFNINPIKQRLTADPTQLTPTPISEYNGKQAREFRQALEEQDLAQTAHNLDTMMLESYGITAKSLPTDFYTSDDDTNTRESINNDDDLDI